MPVYSERGFFCVFSGVCSQLGCIEARTIFRAHRIQSTLYLLPFYHNCETQSAGPPRRLLSNLNQSRFMHPACGQEWRTILGHVLQFQLDKSDVIVNSTSQLKSGGRGQSEVRLVGRKAVTRPFLSHRGRFLPLLLHAECIAGSSKDRAQSFPCERDQQTLPESLNHGGGGGFSFV